MAESTEIPIPSPFAWDPSFDVKSDLTRKARHVVGGHSTDPPKETVCSSVITRDSVRIAFLAAALV